MTDSVSRLDYAFSKMAIRPAGSGLLGRGDGSGLIVADASKRMVYYRDAAGQPISTIRLLHTINILPFIGYHPELENIRVELGYPQLQPDKIHIISIEYGSGEASVGGFTPDEQMLTKAQYPDVGSILNLRLSPNNPIDGEFYVNPGMYIDANGDPAWFGGDSTNGLAATARAAMGVGEHQMGVVYIDGTTGELAIVTNTAEMGTASDKQVFDVTTIVGMTYPAGAVPCGAAHLYKGQTLGTEDDIYRSSDPRILFKGTGSSGGTMSSFTISADEGTPEDVEDGDSVIFAGGDSIGTAVSAPDTITIDVLDGSIGTDELANNAVTNDKMADNSVGAAEIINGSVGTTELADDAVTQDKIADNAIGAAQIQTDAVTQTKILDGAVTTSKINDTAVTDAKLASNAVTTGKIANLAVTDAKINDVAIGKLTGLTTKGDLIARTTTGPVRQAVGALDGQSLNVDSSATTGLSYGSGVIDLTVTWGETVTIRRVVYSAVWDSGKWHIGPDGPIRGIVVDIGASGGVANSTGTVRIYGPVSGYSGLTPSVALWYDVAALNGTMTQTEPTPVLNDVAIAVARVGMAISSSVILVDTHTPVIYRRRFTWVLNGTFAIEHYTDVSRLRRVNVRQIIYDSSLTESYASSNQDTSVPLRGPGTGLTTIDSAGATTSWLGNNGGTDRRSAQSFQVTGNQWLTQFTVRFSTTVGSPTGTVAWSLRTDNAGAPSSTVLTSGAFTPTASSDNTITIAPVFLVSGVTYHFQLQSSNAQSSGNYWQFQLNTSGGYSSGSLKTDTGTAGTYLNTWALGGGAVDLRSTFTTTAIDTLAQSFTAGSNQDVAKVRLWLKKTGSPTGTLTLRIYNNSGGVPGGILLGTAGTISASTLSTSYGWVEFTFSGAAISLSSGTVYHIVLSTSDSASSTNYVEWGADTSSPSLTGAMSAQVSSTWGNLVPSADACFELYKRTTSHEEEMILGRWDSTLGSTNEYALRYNNGSGSNADTITTILNTKGSIETLFDVTLP